MEKKEIVLEKEKETQNTIRYKYEPSGQPPAVKTVYIQKWALGENPPEEIKLTVEEVR